MRKKGKSILVIDDDKTYRHLIGKDLENAGFEVLLAEETKEGKNIFMKYDPCFVIIEADIQDAKGFDFCKWIRTEQKSEIPIMIVSRRTDEMDKINGLRIGADDYITKPFHSQELVVRVETVLRRTSHRCNKISFRGITLKPLRGEVKYHGNLINLTLHEFKLLYFLMRHPNQILSRSQMLDELYPNNDKLVSERTIDVHIVKLREKFKSYLQEEELIETVRGVGYRFIAF